MDSELIKDCIREVLSERSSISPDLHKDHHNFLSDHIPLLKEYLELQNEEMIMRKEKRARRDKIMDAAVGTAVVASVSAGITLLAWVGHTVVQAVIHIINTSPTGGTQ